MPSPGAGARSATASRSLRSCSRCFFRLSTFRRFADQRADHTPNHRTGRARNAADCCSHYRTGSFLCNPWDFGPALSSLTLWIWIVSHNSEISFKP
jgi:hypothetical protein